MSRFTTKNDLYGFVSITKEKYRISDGSYPLNIIEICEERNDVDIEITDIKKKGLCGLVFLGNKVNTIILNSNRNSRERNYDCAHEVIHIIKHRDLGIREFKCFENEDPLEDNIEWQANEGAAELLVPYRMLLPIIRENRDHLESFLDIQRLKAYLAGMFNVSDTVIKMRFENLKYEIFQYLSGCPIDELEILSRTSQKRRGIKVRSINDIEESDYCNCIVPDVYISQDERELLDKLKFGE